jgi:hypothetical protein
MPPDTRPCPPSTHPPSTHPRHSCLNAKSVGQTKNVNLPGVHVDLPVLTSKVWPRVSGLRRASVLLSWPTQPPCAPLNATRCTPMLLLLLVRPPPTEQDLNDLVNFAVRHQLDFVAASFVQSADDVRWAAWRALCCFSETLPWRARSRCLPGLAAAAAPPVAGSSVRCWTAAVGHPSASLPRLRTRPACCTTTTYSA